MSIGAHFKALHQVAAFHPGPLVSIILFVTISGLLAAFLYWLRESISHMGEWAYPLAFIINGLSSATVVIPTPGLALIALMGHGLNPFVLGLSAGVGGTLGEISGYWLGAQCYPLLKEKRFYDLMNRFMKRHGGITIFLAGLLPFIPIDLAGLVAGYTGYSARSFLLYLGAGKVGMTVAFLYLTQQAFDWTEPYLNWLT